MSVKVKKFITFDLEEFKTFIRHFFPDARVRNVWNMVENKLKKIGKNFCLHRRFNLKLVSSEGGVVLSAPVTINCKIKKITYYGGIEYVEENP